MNNRRYNRRYKYDLIYGYIIDYRQQNSLQLEIFNEDSYKELYNLIENFNVSIDRSDKLEWRYYKFLLIL